MSIEFGAKEVLPLIIGEQDAGGRKVSNGARLKCIVAYDSARGANASGGVHRALQMRVVVSGELWDNLSHVRYESRSPQSGGCES